MSTYFTPYHYASKTIRVKYDAEKGKFWFVVVDVLSLVYANPETFWNNLKNELSTTITNSSDYYATWKTDQGTVDVADRLQISVLLKFIPNRKAKKERVRAWVYNPLPSKIIEMVNIAMSDGVMTDTERANIIEKANTHNIPTDFINQYINDALEQRKQYMPRKQANNSESKIYEYTFNQETNSLEVNEKTETPPGCSFFLIIGFIEWMLMEARVISGVGFVLLLIVQFFALCIYIEKISPDKDKSKYNKIINQNRTKSETKIPPSIKEWIRAALKYRIMTFEKRTEIVSEAVGMGVNNTQINSFIDNAIRERLKSKKIELTTCQHCNEQIPTDSWSCPFCGKRQIWHEIKDLTRLALADRVLTDLERQTIVNKAVKGGISKEEINRYLDEQLNLRLESYTKVDLRDCPYCGAQIPLISDECLYCGKPLEHIEGSTNMAFNISGREADIIRSENRRVEQERHGIQKCPDCGAQFPLISNICPSCGHVLHERDENTLNIKNLLNNIMRSINRVNDAPKPKVYQIIGYWFFYILLGLSVFAFIVGIIADNELSKIISLAGFIFGIILMGTNAVLSDTKSPVLIADGEYYKARHAYEMYARQIETLYGNNHEAQTLLRHFSVSLKKLKRERYINRRKVVNIIAIAAMMIMGIITYFGTSEEKKNVPPPRVEMSIPKKTSWALNFSKTLKPSPLDNGVELRLRSYLKVNKEAELTFVMAKGYDSAYHWKVNKVELAPGYQRDFYYPNLDSYSKHPLNIQLLDSNFHAIWTLSGSIVSSHPNCNYKTVMLEGKPDYYADFWSKHPTASDTVMKIIAQKAAYYTIYSSKL